MPTGQSIITGALTTLGMNEQGGQPSVSDTNDALAELNNQWEAWGIDEGLIYSIQSTPYALSAGVPSYSIGPGAIFSSARPKRIYQAIAVATVGAGNMRRQLDLVDSGHYYGHADLMALATLPDELYVDYNLDANGWSKVYVYPVPKVLSPTMLEIEASVAFTGWTLANNVFLPDGYADALNYALAFRLIARFGQLVPQEVAQMVIAAGEKAEARIRVMNERNRRIPPGSGMTPTTPPATGGTGQAA